MILIKFAILIAFSHYTSADKTYSYVNLTYAYQAKCPYSLNFLAYEFYPGYKKLSRYINLDLVLAVGVGDNNEITCARGPNECLISKAQACAFSKPGVKQTHAVMFLYCTVLPVLQKREVLESDIVKCVDIVLKNIVSYKDLKDCIYGKASEKLLKSEYDKRKQLGVHRVPWLRLNGKYSEETENELRTDFEETICNLLSNPPSECDY